MNKHSLLALFLLALIPACGGSTADGDEGSRSADELRRAKAPAASEPTLPSVCTHNTSEASCLADAGCAWGDPSAISSAGSGLACFYVGEIVPQPDFAAPPTLPPAADAGPPDQPTLPSVCTHNTSEVSCLTDPGCAWGNQGSGPACFYVGEIIPFGK